KRTLPPYLHPSVTARVRCGVDAVAVVVVRACLSLLPVPDNQVEFVVHGVTRGSMFRPVAARQPSIRWGRYWIFFSLRLMMRTRPATSAAAKLTMDRLSSDQMPSAGFMSGAYAGSRYTRSQALFSAAKL